MTPSPESESVHDLLDEQVAYYRARSSEYDEWFLRRGRYNHGPRQNERWFDEVEVVRDGLAAVQSGLPAAPAVLELACGTGLWTEHLAPRAASLTAVDASPEVISLNRRRFDSADLPLRIDYQVADLFEWRPTRRYDLVFFGFWLSHIPPSHFEDFWERVADSLLPGGCVFFVDNLRSSTSGSKEQKLPGPGSMRASRELNDGRQFDIVKVFYHPQELEERLESLGFATRVSATANYFIYGAGARA